MPKRTKPPKGESIYICSECAKDRGAKDRPYPGNIVTMHSDVCFYCKQVKSLCAVDDYLWGKNSRRPPGGGGGHD